MKTDLVVNGFCIHNDKLLIIHHKKLNKWLTPGGHIDENETPDQALIREFEEETNLNVELLNKNVIPESEDIKEQLAVPFYVNTHSVGDHDHCSFFYLCTTKDPEKLKIRPEEVLGAKWVTKEELEEDQQAHQSTKDIGKIAFYMWETLKEY